MADLEKWEDRAEILKALAHPTRLFVVDKIQEEPRSVGWLAEQVECDISTMSRHLSVLSNQDIVADEKQGTTVMYSLQMPCVLNFFSCAEEVIEEKKEV